MHWATVYTARSTSVCTLTNLKLVHIETGVLFAQTVVNMARIRKRDKWKLMLDDVEEKHRQLEATVADLEDERVRYTAPAMGRVEARGTRAASSADARVSFF